MVSASHPRTCKYEGNTGHPSAHGCPCTAVRRPLAGAASPQPALPPHAAFAIRKIPVGAVKAGLTGGGKLDAAGETSKSGRGCGPRFVRGLVQGGWDGSIVIAKTSNASRETAGWCPAAVSADFLHSKSVRYRLPTRAVVAPHFVRKAARRCGFL
ncbi:hypothetical protein HPB50_024250 [Hyalomma asiaticum]|uniref:Uncharacterized protein n=1 Tax=Hyalomma asiaticum TaxID=266040 RepID=A0ACB7S9G1_HYAAI|nr:hypothetical protein HPB50_024250 [Hyalomma asiaticum]